MVRKRKSVAAVSAPTPKKASKKWRRARGTQTFTHELALAKPLKMSKKFVARSWGLSIAEKACPIGVKIASKKMSSTSVGESDATQVSLPLMVKLPFRCRPKNILGNLLLRRMF
jgi:hypothetical protein